VRVISPTLHPGLARLLERKAIRVVQRNYRAGDLKGAAIVIAATDQREINHKVAGAAKRRGILANVVDDREPSDFIVPSFFRRGDLTLAVSTGGMSPALARKIRTRLEKEFRKEYATLVSLISQVRSDLKKSGITVTPGAWQNAIDLDSLISLVRSGHAQKAKALLLNRLKIHTPLQR
jgi:siroheme synthase-like protein